MPTANAVTLTQPQLPHHAQLNFDVAQGNDNFKIGEASHTLNLAQGHYVLSSEIKTTGIINVLKNYRLLQTSSGSYTERTLTPDTFVEEVFERNEIKTQHVTFDRPNHKIIYTAGNEVTLENGTQDSLSVLYQLPTILQQTKTNEVAISNGKFVEKSNFEIVGKEQLDTHIGSLPTLHLRKIRSTGMEGMEVWFAQDYRWLPVKIAHFDRNGHLTAVVLITAIQLSDDEK